MGFLEYYNNQLLVESASPNTHIEHLEDLIINDGRSGIQMVKKIIDGALLRLQGYKSPVQFQMKMDGCVHPDTIVKTNIGDMSIFELIERTSTGEGIHVYTMNMDTGVDEFSMVVDESCIDGDKKWVELFLEDGSSIKLTEDHEVHTTNRGWVKAVDLTSDDDVSECSIIG